MQKVSRCVCGGALLMGLLLAGCRSASPPTAASPGDMRTVAVEVAQSALAPAAACENRFVTHKLSVATGTRMREISTYTSNGAGLAANDLDGDGDLDLVFASIDRESTILWNDGGLSFSAEPLDATLTRAVNTVDVDGDGLLDIVFTHRGTDTVSYWRNQGDAAEGQRFVRSTLPGVEHYAYSMAWDDLNGDGTLDFVTGAYDVDLKGSGVGEEQIKQQGGVVLYEQHDGQFRAQQLDGRAEALAIGLVDLDGDGQRDIWAANDFALPDGTWVQRDGTWEATKPFRTTSYSTMSIDWGDLANDGRTAIYTTDMNPGDLATQTLAEWLPVISKLEEKHGPKDPQIMANVLQVTTGTGGWRNEAPRRAIDATGWSWSGKFGDLDNDGFLDLYVVNGMIAKNLFAHLPNDELVEENRAFRNRGDGSFDAAPTWGLGSTASGRGMIMADLDGDGDLDVVVNNLRSPAELFENRLCAGAGLEVDVAWTGSANTHALGAVLDLHTSQGVMRRDIRSASGYLSGDPTRIHFGIPADAELHELVIHFPDGATARVPAPAPNTLLKVTR